MGIISIYTDADTTRSNNVLRERRHTYTHIYLSIYQHQFANIKKSVRMFAKYLLYITIHSIEQNTQLVCVCVCMSSSWVVIRNILVVSEVKWWWYCSLGVPTLFPFGPFCVHVACSSTCTESDSANSPFDKHSCCWLTKAKEGRSLAYAIQFILEFSHRYACISFWAS